MRIAQIGHRYHPYIGGVQKEVKEISERLVRMGFEEKVVTTDLSKRLAREEIINGATVK